MLNVGTGDGQVKKKGQKGKGLEKSGKIPAEFVETPNHQRVERPESKWPLGGGLGGERVGGKREPERK